MPAPVRVLTKDEAQAMIAEALAIVAELEPPDDLRVVAFTSSLNIIGQHTLAESPLGIPAMAIPGMRRR